MRVLKVSFYLCFVTLIGLPAAWAQPVVIQGETVYTMAGDPITNGIVVVEDGKIKAVGSADQVRLPDGATIHKAAVVTPGLIDAHTAVGLTGYLNQEDDQEQVERSEPIQPDLRAIDAYNARDYLVGWVREHGITTVHTGHGPGALMAGQTMLAKTSGDTIDTAVIEPFAMLATTLGDAGLASGGKSPGTKAKMMAMLRDSLLEAQAYQKKLATAEEGKAPARDLHKEALVAALAGDVHLLITASTERDILNALRLAEEFDLKIVLDDAAEAYLLLDEIKAAGVPIILHPTMKRSYGDRKNLSMNTAAKLKEAGIPFALQSGFEAYVPKTRVVLFEAAIAAAYGLGMENALAAITIDAAKILGIDNRVGSLEPGKDADIVLFDGDPFEYVTHVTAVFINGELVSDVKR